MKNIKNTIFFGLLSLATIGCNARIPPGHVGMKIDLKGIEEEVLPAGLHTCFGRDRMVAIELAEETTTEEMSILCADDLNFSFDINIRSKLAATSPELITSLLVIQGKNINWEPAGDFDSSCEIGVISRDFLYETYVRPQARSIARDVVSKYETVQIRENREKIQGEIQKKLVESLEGTPMEVTMVTTSDFDYPDVITKAVEKKRAREIALQEEQAKQKMEMLRAENRQKVAEKMKAVRVAEAEAESAYNKITGQSLTSEYLQLRTIEAQQFFFEQIGKNDKIIMVPSQSNMPMMINMPQPTPAN